MIAIYLVSVGLLRSKERGRQGTAEATQQYGTPGHGTPAVKSKVHTWLRMGKGTDFLALPTWLQAWPVENPVRGYAVFENT